jgi:hypothetical protein
VVVVVVVVGRDLVRAAEWSRVREFAQEVRASPAALARQSRGNPFWAIQISVNLESAPAAVPPVARTLTNRLSRSLSPEARDALAVVEAGDRLAVAHPLIGSAAVDSLPPGRRQQLYRRLASAASDAERYAHFVALAAGPGPDPAVADALETAAAAAHSRAANSEAGQFAAQAVLFTPGSGEEAPVRRRIRAGELQFLAGDLQCSLEHLEVLDLDKLSTPDLEHVLPLLLDLIDFIRGTAAATAMITRAVGAGECDPRRRALVLAPASDVVYGIPGSRGAAAIEAISCAEVAGAS